MTPVCRLCQVALDRPAEAVYASRAYYAWLGRRSSRLCAGCGPVGMAASRRRAAARFASKRASTRAAAGLCVECAQPTPMNTRTGKPFRRCFKHRLVESQRWAARRAA